MPRGKQKSDISSILKVLKEVSGVDFRHYRESTLRRRIDRRMLANRIDSLSKYARLVRESRAEAGTLYEDFLIRVTSFFRGPETFRILTKKVFPELLKNRGSSAPLRIWVPGCATGEEVYSIAIGLFESMERMKRRPPVRIFATDISDASIERARAGTYPESIAAQVSPERLRRFFVRRNPGYQVSKDIREVCVFARQNLGADPPFSGLDLISCRNLLIYMDPALQRRIFPILHYALKPGGYLVLGSAETVRGFEGLFEVVDKRGHVFVKDPRPNPRVELLLAAGGVRAKAVALLNEVAPRGRRAAGTATMETLKRALKSSKSDVRSIIVELEATNEALTAANEEILSSNEELQSTNEELETAKEELQSTNEELLAANVKYRRLFENAREGILIAEEKTGVILDVNPFLLAVLGARREDFVAHRIQRVPLLSYGKPAVDAWSLPGPEGTLAGREVQLRSATGKPIWFHRVVSRYESDGRSVLQWNLRDITESRILMQELIQTQKLETVGGLAAGIAHDFNNILAIISSYAENLRRSAPPPADGNPALDAIDSAVVRGAGLVKQLLAFGRRREPEAFRDFDVNRVVEETVGMLKGTFPKRITLDLQMEAGLPPIGGDPTQIQQVLVNLCMNSRDAIRGPGRIVVSTSLAGAREPATSNSAGPETTFVRISVSDTGSGIDEATRARIFEPFFTTRRDAGGSGLGLSVVYGIVTAHNGHIEVESTVGKGTTFEVLLPTGVRQASEVPEFPRASPPPRTRRRGAPETVLVVEDEPLLLQSLQELIEGEGYRVLTARNGLQAVEQYEREDISVVLSDLGMPELGGWEAFVRMKAINPSARVILVSGFAEPRERTQMQAGGVAAFLTKPYRAEDVLRTIREVLEK